MIEGYVLMGRDAASRSDRFRIVAGTKFPQLQGPLGPSGTL